MKVNKITAIACLSITIISGILLVIYKNNVVLQSVFSGVFTGFIVSFVVAIIGYFHERAKITEAIDVNIRNLFINIKVMSMILGNVLPKIHGSYAIDDLPFKNISTLASLNSEFIEKMDLGLYDPLYNKSKKFYACQKLNKFNSAIYAMKNHSSSLEKQVLNYCILLLEIQKNQMMGIQTNPIQEKNLDDLKNVINIHTAKFHEYVTAQSIELAEIGKEFYGYKKKHLSWNDIETALTKDAENIVNAD